MPAASLPSPVVPYGADETVFVVIDSSPPGELHRQFERADLDAVVADLMRGQFNDPLQVVAFNTLEHWTQDLSADVANEIVALCDIEVAPMPDHLRDFVDRHMRRGRMVR